MATSAMTISGIFPEALRYMTLECCTIITFTAFCMVNTKICTSKRRTTWISKEMARMMPSESQRDKKWRSLMSFLLIRRLIMLTERLFTGLAVNGQMIIEPVEALSSPSHINATKGSSVWLHWNYTYIGDGIHNGTTTFFSDQMVIAQSISPRRSDVLATKSRQNGPFTIASIPPQFTGRLGTISSNTTLVINNLQYTDSNHKFLSRAFVRVGGAGTVTFHLRPVVSLTVYGIPDFIRHPQSALDVDENALLQLTVHMDGNPRPSADFRWLHLDISSPTNVPIVQLSPFLYSSTYTMNNIDASYCGKILQTTVTNSRGSSMRSTNVTVLLKLENSFDLRVQKFSALRCVEARWNLTQSGACHVTYNVTFRDVTGANLFNISGYNITRMRNCDASTYNSVNDVQLKVNFKNRTKIITKKIHDVGSTAMIHGVSLVALSQSLICCLWWLISDASY